METQTAYTIPSIRSSKYGFMRRKRQRTNSFASSSGMAAPKNAVAMLPPNE